MKKIFAVLAALLVLAGCGARRVGPMAPRRPDVPEHRGVKSNSECMDCHDVAKIKDHNKEDNCLSCHFVIPGR